MKSNVTVNQARARLPTMDMLFEAFTDYLYLIYNYTSIIIIIELSDTCWYKSIITCILYLYWLVSTAAILKRLQHLLPLLCGRERAPHPHRPLRACSLGLIRYDVAGLDAAHCAHLTRTDPKHLWPRSLEHEPLEGGGRGAQRILDRTEAMPVALGAERTAYRGGVNGEAAAGRKRHV